MTIQEDHQWLAQLMCPCLVLGIRTCDECMAHAQEEKVGHNKYCSHCAGLDKRFPWLMEDCLGCRDCEPNNPIFRPARGDVLWGAAHCGGSKRISGEPSLDAIVQVCWAVGLAIIITPPSWYEYLPETWITISRKEDGLDIEKLYSETRKYIEGRFVS